MEENYYDFSSLSSTQHYARFSILCLQKITEDKCFIDNREIVFNTIIYCQDNTSLSASKMWDEEQILYCMVSPGRQDFFGNRSSFVIQPSISEKTRVLIHSVRQFNAKHLEKHRPYAWEVECKERETNPSKVQSQQNCHQLRTSYLLNMSLLMSNNSKIHSKNENASFIL